MPYTVQDAKDLFIVDNSDLGWKGLRYLEEWCEISSQFDIATGYFEIGALLALDGKWQRLDQIRILMGSETTLRTRNHLIRALREKFEKLNSSLEAEKLPNPSLKGVASIAEAMRTGRIQCRVYDKDKFHAKAYITHSRIEVVGSQALVGSSNFTKPGLTQNVELNVQIQSSREVNQLREWFEEQWEKGREVTEDVLQVIDRQIRQYMPFEVYAKALQELFRAHQATANEWDESHSHMFPLLDRYQKEAYWAMLRIARTHRGAFLCDGVGLGKTFVGLMLIERLILHEDKRVLLLAPKAAKEGVWEPHIEKWLPHIGGEDFGSLVVLSHTDLTRGGMYPKRLADMASKVDAVVIDEAHHFRNRGTRGGDEKDPSRYWRLFDFLDPEKRPKRLFMLTATPINNRLTDFRHMIELFTREDDQWFGRTLGINNLKAHFRQLERAYRDRSGRDSDDVTDDMREAESTLTTDRIFTDLVVQRSRSYARESQLRESGKAAMFPQRANPQVAEYSIRKTYGQLLKEFDKAFERQNPLFTLAMYYPLQWYKGDRSEVEAFEENRQKQVVSLIRTGFLKRFESSVPAFQLSCDRLLRKLMAFVEVNSETESEKRLFERWKAQYQEVLGYARQQSLLLHPEDDSDADEDLIPPELLKRVERLDRQKYEVHEMLEETRMDMHQLASFLVETSRWETKHDDKLRKLIRLLNSKELVGEKVLIFTEFADTARYLERQLKAEGFQNVFAVDSGTKVNRADVIRRFAPYYNGSSSGELAEQNIPETRILISTDVLSEGLNLQDATKMINYDIHWNPVRLMQRIGRVDRRMDPAIEDQIMADHPERSDSRGKIRYWNFLPPDELNDILTLFSRVSQKTLVISRTLGIEGGKLLRPDDDYEVLKEFNHAYEGERTAIENMHLEFQQMLKDDPELQARLSLLPGAVFSGRIRFKKGVRGVFFCYALPALDPEKNEFTEEAGRSGWYLLDLDRDEILEEPGEIASSIRSEPSTPRQCRHEDAMLIDLRARVEKHITNTYLKRVDAPVGIRPTLKCWMELSDE